MSEQAEELNPLVPTPFEVGLYLLTLAHTVLVLFVVLQMLRGKLAVPHGLLGFIVMLFVPVVGPLLVLTWQSRVDRHVARSSQLTA